MKRLVLAAGILLCGCKKAVTPGASVDNTATRYAAGLVSATEKAKTTVETANRTIAATQANVDKMAEEVQE